jgi:hypothetical protein
MIYFGNKKVITSVVASLLIIAIFLFWVTGVIPSFIAKISAEKYVKSKYIDRDLKITEVYWDKNMDRYFVSFTDESGNRCNFKMSEYIPSTVMYDPLDPPG